VVAGGGKAAYRRGRRGRGEIKEDAFLHIGIFKMGRSMGYKKREKWQRQSNEINRNMI